MHDDEMLDSVALLALGVLGEQEAQAVRRAIDADPRLRKEYDALRATADLIGYSADVPGVVDEMRSARMKARLRKAIGAGSSTRPVHRIAWPAWAAAAAALVLALGATLQNVALRGDVQSARDTVASLRERVEVQTKLATERERQLADLFAPDAKRYPVTGGEVVQRGDHLYLTLRDLPKLPRGKVFQAWTLASGEKAVAPSLTFVPTENGSVVVALPPQTKRLSAVAISVEPSETSAVLAKNTQ
jgi:hypothetical protein